MKTATRLFGSWNLNNPLAIIFMMFTICIVSCSYNENCDNLTSMAQVQLVSLSDTIPSDELLYEPYDIFIYLPKVGCSSCGSKDIAFLEAFMDKVDKKKTALITHIVNYREQTLLERQLGIRVYRLLDYRKPLFHNQKNRNGIIFRTKVNGYATDILELRYNAEEICDYFEAINRAQ